VRYLVRDLGSFGLGAFIVVWQTITGEQNNLLLIIAAMCLGLPGADHLIKVLARLASTEPPSSPPQPPAPPGPSGN